MPHIHLEGRARGKGEEEELDVGLHQTQHSCTALDLASSCKGIVIQLGHCDVKCRMFRFRSRSYNPRHIMLQSCTVCTHALIPHPAVLRSMHNESPPTATEAAPQHKLGGAQLGRQCLELSQVAAAVQSYKMGR
jgi:hypothetical protein